MSMLLLREEKYRVEPNDSLWKIAQRKYGDPRRWPEIAARNRLRNPDVVFVGQILTIPGLSPASGTREFGNWYTLPPMTPYAYTPQPSPVASSNRERGRTLPPMAKEVALPAFQFKFPEQDLIPPIQGLGWRARFQMFGSVVLQKRGKLTTFTVENLKTIEAEYESKYRTQFADLATKISLGFDPEKKKLTLGGEFTQTVKFQGKEWNSYTVKIEPTKVTFKMAPAPAKGVMGDVDINGKIGYQVVIELEDTKRTPQSEYQLQPVRRVYYAIDMRAFLQAVAVVLVAAVAAVILVKMAAVAAVVVIAFATLLLFLPTSPGPIPTTVPTI